MRTDEEQRALNEQRIKDTWDELGLKVRPMTWYLFVRTEHKPWKTHTGNLYLPPKMHNWNGPMPHLDLIKGLVIASGPISIAKSRVLAGERVIFKRLHFAWWKKMQDGTMFGWIPAGDVLGYPYDDDESDEKAECQQQPRTAKELGKAAGYGF
jgi:hypothetical protein